MGRGIRLTEAQWEELDRLRFTTPSAEVFRNCLIVLQSDSQASIAAIAHDLGCCPDTVKRVRRLYRTGGSAALHPGKSPGRPCRATPPFRDQLRRAVQTNPLALGYGFSTWSAARLAAHLAKVTGISYSDDQLRRLLKQEGFSFRRPKHTLKGKRDEAAYAQARQRLRRLKKKLCRPMRPKRWSSRTRSRSIATPP